MDDPERVTTRKSLRNRSRTWKKTDTEKERTEYASDSADDVIEVEPETPQAPRRNRIRRKSTSTTTSANTSNEGEHTHEESQTLTTILRVVEELRTNNGVSNKIANELRSNNEQLKASNDQLKVEMEELKTLTRHLAEEVSAVKATLAQLTAAIQCSAPAVASAGSSTRGSTERSSPRTYASVLTNSTDPSSSASQAQTPSSPSHPRSPNPGVTVDTRRVKDKSKLADAVGMEKTIRQHIQAVDAVSNIAVIGIRIRGHHTRVLTSSEKDAALLRTHDEWG
jgi:hypothetical protein